jgi:hypothetical protein
MTIVDTLEQSGGLIPLGMVIVFLLLVIQIIRVIGADKDMMQPAAAVGGGYRIFKTEKR